MTERRRVRVQLDLEMFQDGMLEQMSSVLQFRNVHGLWHARANKCPDFGHGETADEAMREALRLQKEMK